MALGNSAINDFSGEQGVVYTGEAQQIFRLSAVENVIPELEKEAHINHGILIKDIAQSHHYTITLSDFGNMSGFVTPEGTWSNFLPVKNITLNYTSYENMSIPLAIFGDFPLLNKKRVSTIALTCYDLDTNDLESQLRIWENACFPKGRYVAYMEDIVKKLTYKGYNTKGKNTLTYNFYVIPSGNVSVARDYSTNDAKYISFTLVCVGDGATCATGEGRAKVEDKQNAQEQKLAYNQDNLKIKGKNWLSGDDQTTEQGFNELLKNRELLM